MSSIILGRKGRRWHHSSTIAGNLPHERLVRYSLVGAAFAMVIGILLGIVG